jgi:hypothetical protein
MWNESCSMTSWHQDLFESARHDGGFQVPCLVPRGNACAAIVMGVGRDGTIGKSYENALSNIFPGFSMPPILIRLLQWI